MGIVNVGSYRHVLRFECLYRYGENNIFVGDLDQQAHIQLPLQLIVEQNDTLHSLLSHWSPFYIISKYTSLSSLCGHACI